MWVNVTGEPASPPAVAMVLCAPAVGPRVRVTDVVPSAPVTVDGFADTPATLDTPLDDGIWNRIVVDVSHLHDERHRQDAVHDPGLRVPGHQANAVRVSGERRECECRPYGGDPLFHRHFCRSTDRSRASSQLQSRGGLAFGVGGRRGRGCLAAGNTIGKGEGDAGVANRPSARVGDQNLQRRIQDRSHPTLLWTTCGHLDVSGSPLGRQGKTLATARGNRERGTENERVEQAAGNHEVS